MMDAYNAARTPSNKGSISDLKKGALPVAEEENEADEPLLVENKNRFVLFPIKYHEVCHDRFSLFTSPSRKGGKGKEKKRN